MSVRRGELDGAPAGDDVVLELLVDELGAVVCAIQFGAADVHGIGLPLVACVDGVGLGVHEENVAAACGFINEPHGEPATMNVRDGERAFGVAVYSVTEYDGGMAWWLGFRGLRGPVGFRKYTRFTECGSTGSGKVKRDGGALCPESRDDSAVIDVAKRAVHVTGAGGGVA